MENQKEDQRKEKELHRYVVLFVISDLGLNSQLFFVWDLATMLQQKLPYNLKTFSNSF
jgi:hypothetical protein